MRLISPQGRRIYPNATTGTGLSGTGLSGAGPLVLAQREGLKPGEADEPTCNSLLKLGWQPYDGPAVTNDRGYIIKPGASQ